MIFNCVNNFISIITDRRCYSCGRITDENHNLCIECKNKFSRNHIKICLNCNKETKLTLLCEECNKNKVETIHFDSFQFVQYYYSYCKSIVMIHKKKFDPGIIKLYYQLLTINCFFDKTIPITVVPDSNIKRYFKSRSSLVLLLKLFKMNGYKVEYGMLIKKNNTKNQKLRNFNERKAEIVSDYYINDNFKKKHISDSILLVDDIFTTGSTINYCSNLLKDVGYKHVHSICVFKTVLKSNR